ncbi:hypothetical protein Tco_0468897 [Tanacetum coccineum]
MSTLTFSDTYKMVTFLEKPAESDGFHEIIDFLNANQIRYALIVNPTIYTPCIEQFWATSKIKKVNGECQLQALVDKKKVIITETSIRSDLHLEDASGIDCLPTATIFEELARMGYKKSSQKLTFYKVFFSPQWKFLIHTIMQCLSAKTTAWNKFSSTMASLGDMSHHKKIYVNPSHTKKIFTNMKRERKDFSRRVTPLFATMMVQANQEEGVDSVPHPSDSTVGVPNEESVPTHSNDLLLSGEDRLKLTDLMDMCTKLSERFLDLEYTKTAQAQEITNLKLRVKKLEKKAGLRTHKFKRLYKVGVTRRVEYLDDESLGAQKDASNQGKSIEDIDKDAKVSLVDETQGRPEDAEMFDTDALIVSTAAPSTTAVPPHDITVVEITLAQTLAKLKSAKSKGKLRWMKKDQIALDEEMDRNVKAQIQAELIEEERLARKKEKEANIALIESWDNIQAMIEADFELAQRLQAEEQGEITIKERSRLFVELMNKRKKHFVKLRAKEKRRKPPTKAQKRNLMSTYLKNMDGYKYN